jgi:PAS domain S-box-containing protein
MPKPHDRTPASREPEKPKTAGSLRVLIVEDMEGDAALIIRRLEAAGYEVEPLRVETADGMKAALAASRWDVVISDYRLPQFDAFGSLGVLRESKLDIPFIVVSGTIGEETAVALMKAGAHDYVMKGNLTRLVPAIERELGEAAVRNRRRAAEALLQSSEKKFRELVEEINDGIFTLDAEGIITYASPPALLLTGRNADRFIGRHFSEIIHPDDMPGLERSFKDTLENRIQPWEFRYITRDGKQRWARTSSRPVVENGRVIGIRGVFSDITGSKRAEIQRRIVSETQSGLLQTEDLHEIYRLVAGKVAQLLGNAIVVTTILDEYTQTLKIAAYEGLDVPLEKITKLLGVDFMGMTFPLGDIAEEELKSYRSGRLERQDGGLYALSMRRMSRAVCSAAEKMLRIDGIHTMGFVWKDRHYGGLVVMARGDISDARETIEMIMNQAAIVINRQRAETAQKRSEAEFRSMADDALAGIIRVSLSREILYSNKALAGIFGFDTPEEFENRDIAGYFKDPAQLELMTGEIISSGRLLNRELAVLTKTGIERQVLFSAVLNGRTVTVTLIDVTERYRMEKQIKDDLKEKETLLKEIHHRVKNNMQIVISLLNLQSADIGDPAILAMFRESRNRIFSMALVHEMLYGSEKFSSIDFGKYLAKLVENIEEAYKTGSRRVACRIEAEHLELGIEDAIPCGLIVQEIVSNSHKHAFPEHWKGEPRIHIRILAEGETVELTVGDNGVGIPGRSALGESKSLGMTLIRLLGKDQLGGEVSFESGEAGTEFKIRFTAE